MICQSRYCFPTETSQQSTPRPLNGSVSKWLQYKSTRFRQSRLRLRAFWKITFRYEHTDSAAANIWRRSYVMFRCIFSLVWSKLSLQLWLYLKKQPDDQAMAWSRSKSGTPWNLLLIMQTFLLLDILGGSRFPGVLVGQKGLYMRRSHLLTMVDEMSDVRYKPEYYSVQSSADRASGSSPR